MHRNKGPESRDGWTQEFREILSKENKKRQNAY